MTGRSGRKWTPEEDKMLLERAGSLTCEQIGGLLGRSVNGVFERAKVLGVSTRRWVQKSPPQSSNHPWRRARLSRSEQ
jgi:hypothetical protein